ncbi:RICIN domain-containing protein [Kitasatospora viridis]|uniref:Ricin-type beta-trefoil lectin protein n=1 Tax=Kitasatospora viridis TaxID=281105 RepID=A0A561SE24_9ACTN|nr:RICIN domain-containing protein [Kitasatospora viridis]TWF73123.1 ricin-type beta-trefoil lectin protein [Kitasatospora viridis]
MNQSHRSDRPAASRRARRVLAALTAFTATATLYSGLAGAAQAAPGPTARPTDRQLCTAPAHAGGPVCQAVAHELHAPGVSRAKALADAASITGYTPADLQAAYGVTALAGGTGGQGQTVAITDQGGDAQLESDLAAYRQQFNLPACTTQNGCFSKLNESGQQGNYPAENTAWEGEQALDVEMVSALCPNCRIVVVETDRTDGQTAAVNSGAKFISNSWGSGQLPASDYDHPGVLNFAAAGDGGTATSYPAAFASVIAVGGTSLTRDGSARGWHESVWSGSGGGCTNEAKPAWQHDALCTTRTENDISAEADPGTGTAFYNQGSWCACTMGGTSAATPIVAAIAALAGTPAANAVGAQALYADSSSAFNDVTTGSNGSCGAVCTAGPGYDSPSGLGTPNGAAPFGAQKIRVLANPASGLVADAQSSGTANGTKVQAWSPNGSNAQRWIMNYLADGNFWLAPANAPASALDANNWAGSTVDGTTHFTQLWSYGGGGNQEWKFVSFPNNLWEVVNGADQGCLTEVAQGTTLTDSPCTGSGAQLWAVNQQ